MYAACRPESKPAAAAARAAALLPTSPGGGKPPPAASAAAPGSSSVMLGRGARGRPRFRGSTRTSTGSPMPAACKARKAMKPLYCAEAHGVLGCLAQQLGSHLGSRMHACVCTYDD